MVGTNGRQQQQEQQQQQEVELHLEDQHPSVVVFGQEVYVFTRQAEAEADSAA